MKVVHRNASASDGGSEVERKRRGRPRMEAIFPFVPQAFVANVFPEGIEIAAR